jgi:hypothetical protein
LLYVADATRDTVNVYNNPNTAPIKTISLAGSGITSSQPAGLTVDSSGNVYVAMHTQSTGADSVLEIQSAGTHPSVRVFLDAGIPLASGINAANGNLFIGNSGGGYGTDATGGKIYDATNPNGPSRYPTSSSTFGLGTSGLVSDGTYLYAAVTTTSGGAGQIEKISLATQAVTVISTTLSSGPYGLTLDSSGNLYFNLNNGTVDKLANAASLTGATAPTVFNDRLKADVTAGHGPTYLTYETGPFGSGPSQTPEPGSLAMAALISLLALAGYTGKRRQARKQPMPISPDSADVPYTP